MKAITLDTVKKRERELYFSEIKYSFVCDRLKIVIETY